MGLRDKFMGWAMRKELERHGPAIRAEIDRLKSIRTLAELKAWGSEKGGALKLLSRQRGPELLAFIKAEWARTSSAMNKGKRND
ncbi:MAG: hypothetical protein KKE73_06135 [Proteobacteria bacterium]|nr:hypothetical protein [Pseudomonadota bacterium]